ncbi:MAG: class I SAM-dependent methyltransferase [Verrucomicrobia bacterium]|nr:class I SAM-dependent methyltransferase [Verrucomicrobiota bacterium]
MEDRFYDPEYISKLFDRMGPTYDVINLVSSFGFSEFWRYQCVSHLPIHPGAVVCDMMAGSGECWPHIARRTGASGHLLSVDFCNTMVERQNKRNSKVDAKITVLHQNALCTSIPSESVDFVVAAFGLKTLGTNDLSKFAVEICRVLKPGGMFSLIEISVPQSAMLNFAYMLYIRRVIPLVGRLFLGDIAAYRMLGDYTLSFGSCERVKATFELPQFNIELRRHFFGCTTALVGKKTQESCSI